MSVKTEDALKNKIRLIYEYNRKSPLFARIASWELDNNNLESAIEILENGLREYPDYPTPYFILGKIYTGLGEFSKALKCYKKGSEFLSSKETYHFYLRELESLKNLKTPLELRTVKFPDETKEKPNSDKSSKFEDSLDELAEKISRAKIPVVEEKKSKQYVPNENSSGTMIISETLAKIYIAQGEIQEAIEVYNKLIKKDPSRHEYFSQKISELKSKL